MPFLKLNTNVSVDDVKTPQLMSELSQLLAKETGKPERYVMVEVCADKQMIFGGNNEPLAYIECKSIGLSVVQVKSLSHSISQVLKTQLNVSAERIYIEFSHCPADYWGWNGSTFG